MKTKTITQQLIMLKLGFGKRLLLMAFFLLSFMLIRAQAGFNYSSATYCQSGANPTPTMVVPGGFFSSSPTGLIINSTTGTIDLAASSLGTYSVFYDADSSSLVMTITNSNPSATFSYSNSILCTANSDPHPIFAFGASAGIFSATPAGLVFSNVNTGEIDLNASADGNYTVTNTIPASGSCVAVSATAPVLIITTPVVTATPSSQTICSGGTTSIALTSNTPGTTYNWTETDSGVSGSTQGSGNTIAQTLALTGIDMSGYAIYMITPNANGCAGETFTVYVQVNNCGAFSITSPVNGATINNRCDLQFCVLDSFGYSSLNNYCYITEGDSYAADIVALTDQTSVFGIANNFCLNNISSSMNFTPGNHTFYLWFSTNGIFDSVTVNIANPISDLCSNLTYSDTALSGGLYNFSVTGLDPSETYIMHLDDQYGNAIDSSIISNATSGNIMHQYPHNGQFSQGISVHGCNGIVCGDSLSANVTNSGCSAFTMVNTNNVLFSMGTNCLWDTLHTDMDFYYENLLAGTATVTVNWGDGITDTYPYVHGAGSGYLNLSGYLHHYSNPGVYTILCTLFDPSSCYNDSFVQTIDASNPCGNLIGTVYNDGNGNCTQDIGEAGLAGISVTATMGGNTYWAWTDYFGNYSFYTLPLGSYTIQINNINAGYAITCSNSLPHTTTVTSGTTVENFAVSCSGFDVAITGISMMNVFFPGTSDAILPHVGILNASCSQTIAGQVKMVLTSCIQYATSGYSFNNPPDAIIPASTGDTLVWNVSDINNIGSFSYWDYAVNVTTCTSAQVGDSACITMIVLPTVGDVDPSNNTYTRCFEIGVSYDPNYKVVEPKGLGAQGFIPANTPDLTYTVNFQNIGTVAAHNIYILDTIDADLNINSIEILSASHGIQVYQLENRSMKFMFANIMLPDSTSDEANSHGYVTYRIKPNTGLLPGVQIKNTGHIYFDYNVPIATNTTLNTVETPSGITEIKTNGLLKVYPNPAKDRLIVSISNSANSNIVITDVIGKTVKEVKTNELQTQIDISDLQDGIYFIKLTQGTTQQVKKIIVSK